MLITIIQNVKKLDMGMYAPIRKINRMKRGKSNSLETV